MEGLYQVRLEPLTGGKPSNGGVIILRGGQILGGDAFYYYVGSYAVSGDAWSGELTTRQHTRTSEYQPAFGALDAPVALSGTQDGETLSGTAELGSPATPASYRIALQRIAEA